MKEVAVYDKDALVAMYEFYSAKKPTAKHMKADGETVDKILPVKSINKLIKLGVKKITIANPKCEFYSGKKPTAEIRKAVDKVFTDEIVDQLYKVGLMRIKVTNLKELKKNIKNKKPLFD